jgi:hypothetical protein
MKKYFYMFLLSSFVSTTAQNIVINGKLSKPFNENYENAYTFEALLATSNIFSVGILLGFADIHYNIEGYNWFYSTDNDMTKGIIGVVTYIYPLSQTNYNFLEPIYLSLSWSKISDSPSAGGYMFAFKGYTYPNSQNENIWTFSSGYKINLEFVNLLLSVGYQYRGYDLEFREYEGGTIPPIYHSIHQIEKSVQIDVGLQYVF